MLSLVTFFPLLVIGIFGPGWLLGRALRRPAGTLGNFIGSIAMLLNLVVALDALGLPLRATTVAVGLALGCAGLGLVASGSSY